MRDHPTPGHFVLPRGLRDCIFIEQPHSWQPRRDRRAEEDLNPGPEVGLWLVPVSFLVSFLQLCSSQDTRLRYGPWGRAVCTVQFCSQEVRFQLLPVVRDMVDTWSYPQQSGLGSSPVCLQVGPRSLLPCLGLGPCPCIAAEPELSVARLLGARIVAPSALALPAPPGSQL